jgi:hypothetical protein
MSDENWAPLARSSREALRQLGYGIGPQCLPGEPDACGGTFAEHVMAQLATLNAVADHHLEHLRPPADAVAEIYQNIRHELEHADAEEARGHQ